MVIFLFSFKQVGGVPTLFFNLADYFNKINIPFCLISSEKSAIYTMFKEKYFDCLYLNYDTLSTDIIAKEISDKDTIIATYWDQKLPLFSNINPKLIFWNVFPTSIYDSNVIWGRIYMHFRNKRLLKTMLENGGLYFMDDTPLEWMQKYGYYNIPEQLLLQIPVQPINYLYQTKNIENDKLAITYIGRAEIWKLFPLIKIIEDLSNIKHSFKLNIISDDISKTKKFIRLNSKIANNIEFTYSENVANNIIDKHLLSYSDLNIGMGTACIEGAKVGIPSLLIDASYIRMSNNYKYIWIYETKHYKLGTFYNSTTEYNGINMSDIIEKIYMVKNYLQTESNACYSYVNEFHNINTVGQKTTNAIDNCQLHVNDVTNKVFLYSKVFRLKNYVKSKFVLINH